MSNFHEGMELNSIIIEVLLYVKCLHSINYLCLEI